MDPVTSAPEAVIEPVGSASVRVPFPSASTPPAAVVEPVVTTFAIPDAYKEKSYLKGVDSMDKVYAMLDGAQTLIGKRPTGVPASDAPPEEWNKFYDALGRPKTSAEYVFEGADKTDPNFLPKVQEAFHKHGLTTAQAKGVYADISATLQTIAQEKGLADEKQNTDFDALGAKVFGAERDQVLANSKSLIEKHLPAEMKGEFAKLPNESLVILAGVLNNISKTYIKESGPPGGSPPVTGSTAAEISQKAIALMQTDAYINPFHVNHASTKKQVDDLYATLRPGRK